MSTPCLSPSVEALVAMPDNEHALVGCSEDRRLMEADEAIPRHKRGNVQWCKVKAAAGLDRLPHSLRNRLARLEAMGA